jgi:hypothetical protein
MCIALRPEVDFIFELPDRKYIGFCQIQCGPPPPNALLSVPNISMVFISNVFFFGGGRPTYVPLEFNRCIWVYVAFILILVIEPSRKCKKVYIICTNSTEQSLGANSRLGSSPDSPKVSGHFYGRKKKKTFLPLPPIESQLPVP